MALDGAAATGLTGGGHGGVVEKAGPQAGSSRQVSGKHTAHHNISNL